MLVNGTELVISSPSLTLLDVLGLVLLLDVLVAGLVGSFRVAVSPGSVVVLPVVLPLRSLPSAGQAVASNVPQSKRAQILFVLAKVLLKLSNLLMCLSFLKEFPACAIEVKSLKAAKRLGWPQSCQ